MNMSGVGCRANGTKAAHALEKPLHNYCNVKNVLLLMEMFLSGSTNHKENFGSDFCSWELLPIVIPVWVCFLCNKTSTL
jgi:hypothetical protein